MVTHGESHKFFIFLMSCFFAGYELAEVLMNDNI
jgi:hypothetical protein